MWKWASIRSFTIFSFSFCYCSLVKRNVENKIVQKCYSKMPLLLYTCNIVMSG